MSFMFNTKRERGHAVPSTCLECQDSQILFYSQHTVAFQEILFSP